MEKIKQRFISTGVQYFMFDCIQFVMIRTSASVFTFPVEVLTDSDICSPSGSYSYISYFLPRQKDE